MKKLLIIAAAILTLAACTKDATESLDGTHWRYKKVDGERVITCSMTLRKGGEIQLTDKNSYYWNEVHNYRINSYTYDGENHGTITATENGYSGDHTFSYTLKTNKTKLSATFPSGHSLTLELQ